MAVDLLGHAAERVGGVTDAVVVCHDRPQDVIVEVDTTPPRPPYRPDRWRGCAPESPSLRVARLLTPTAEVETTDA